MSAFGEQRQNILPILVHLHGIVVGEFPFVSKVFDVLVKKLLYAAQAFFQNKRHKNFHRGAELASQVVDIILVVALADNKLAIFIDVEVLGVKLLSAELPKFLKVFQC